MLRYCRLFVLILSGFWITQSSCEKNTSEASIKTPGAGGSLARFAIVGNYLYVVNRTSLDAYDITDPAKPVFKKNAFVGFEIETIFPYNDKLFMGGEFGMYIFSIAQPDNPVKEGQVEHFRACDPVVTNDTLAYVTLTDASRCRGWKNELHVYDVKNIQKPVLLNEIGMKSPGGLGIRQNALYVCQGINGMVIFDLANPVKPKWVKELKDESYYDVIPYGNVLIVYIEKGISFYDITNPLNPVLLSKLKG